MRARVGAGAIGFVATISSGLRVPQRLEPIANILWDMLVLAIVAGDAKGWTRELYGENDYGNKAGWYWMKLMPYRQAKAKLGPVHVKGITTVLRFTRRRTTSASACADHARVLPRVIGGPGGEGT